MPLTDILCCDQSQVLDCVTAETPYSMGKWYMAKNVEQVALCKLGEMLGTGSYDELNLGFQLVGEPLPEGPWPQTIHPELLKAIKEASDEQIAKVSSPWARIDEFGGMASPESLVDYLTRLREFLRENDGSFFLVMAL